MCLNFVGLNLRKGLENMERLLKPVVGLSLSLVFAFIVVMSVIMLVGLLPLKDNFIFAENLADRFVERFVKTEDDVVGFGLLFFFMIILFIVLMLTSFGWFLSEMKDYLYYHGILKRHRDGGIGGSGGSGNSAYEADLRAGIIPSNMDPRTDGEYLNRVANEMADESDSFKHE